MCLIIDVNVAHRALLTPNDPDFHPVHASLFSNRAIIGKLVYGGELSREYSRNGSIRRTVALLDRAGRAIKINDGDVDEETALLQRNGSCVSDDPHIIALAAISGTRLLCSHDRDLHADFTNKALLDRPRGKVYQYARHEKLIRHFCG